MADVSNKKVVVLGGGGFLGSFVAETLVEAGYQVVIFDRRPLEGSKYALETIIGDVMCRQSLASVLKGAWAVYNFTGMSDIDECVRRPVDAVKANVLGNAIVLDACVNAKIARYVYASSLYVYSSLGGIYRSTKQACEALIEDYAKYFELDYTILRYGTVYGPRSDKRNSIFRFVKQAVTEGAIRFSGDGSEVREYIHVKDAAKMSVDILDKSFRNECVMLTGPYPVQIKQLFVLINEIMGGKISIQYNCRRSRLVETHYKLTPYSYTPKAARKLVLGQYLDLGQGMLECVSDMHGITGGKPVDQEVHEGFEATS